jgi:site-specific recombinase XerD
MYSDPEVTMSAIRGVYEKEPGSNVWWIRWTDAKGQLHREKAGRKSDAKTLVDKRRTETLQLKKLPEQFRAKITFNSLCDDALEHSRATNDEKVTYDLGLRFERLRLVFGSRDAAAITKQEIVRWLTTESEERNWKPSTRNRWQAAFSLIYRVGIENEKIDKNPAAGIRRKTENNARVRFLSNDEEKALRKAILHRFPAFPEFISQLNISLHTGMRAGEQFGLKWNQVDFERKIVTLPKTKNGNTRHIPLNSLAISSLGALKTKDSEGHVFPSARNAGEGLKGSRGWFVSALKDANINDYTWHCNRHTFASRLVMAGVDLRTVGELLGHKSLSMTMRYAHLAPAHNAAAVDRLVLVPKPESRNRN